MRQRHPALEQDHFARRLSVQADAAERRVPPPHRRVQGYQRHAGRHSDRRRHLEPAQERMVAFDPGRRLHRLADEAGHRSRRLRQLDLAAEGRHRQQARRFRVREDRDVMIRRTGERRDPYAAAPFWRGAVRRRLSNH